MALTSSSYYLNLLLYFWLCGISCAPFLITYIQTELQFVRILAAFLRHDTHVLHSFMKVLIYAVLSGAGSAQCKNFIWQKREEFRSLFECFFFSLLQLHFVIQVNIVLVCIKNAFLIRVIIGEKLPSAIHTKVRLLVMVVLPALQKELDCSRPLPWKNFVKSEQIIEPD